jgi:phenylacetic acid degradation operon negative regulatory protein
MQLFFIVPKIKRYNKNMIYNTLIQRKIKKRLILPQPALLTLYGDYLLDRHEEVGIGSLITLFGNFGLSEHAVRAAVSRMCHAGLLKVRSKGRKSFYSLTKNGHNLLTIGAQRIFVRREAKWDGTWNIVAYSIPERERKTRDTLRRELTWMGFGVLGGSTMVSPYDMTHKVVELAEKLGVTNNAQIFKATQQGLTDARKIVSTCWDLGRIHQKYASFLAEYQPRYEKWLQRLESGVPVEPGEYFVERFTLIHEYRRLPFFDPDLPDELLPEDWLRPKAAALFQDFHDLLTEKATDYVNSVLEAYQRGTK